MNNIQFDQEVANKVTPREKQVIDLMIEGLRNTMIARRLGITVNTVEVHRRNVFKKLECENSAQCVAKLFRSGILI